MIVNSIDHTVLNQIIDLIRSLTPAELRALLCMVEQEHPEAYRSCCPKFVDVLQQGKDYGKNIPY